MSDGSVLFLSVLDSRGFVVVSEVFPKEKSLEAFRAGAKRARKLKGEVKSQEVDPATANELMTQAHRVLMENRKITFDGLLKLIKPRTSKSKGPGEDDRF